MKKIPERLKRFVGFRVDEDVLRAVYRAIGNEVRTVLGGQPDQDDCDLCRGVGQVWHDDSFELVQKTCGDCGGSGVGTPKKGSAK